jgi:HD-GYP domain-containing protein (c-di-GMP phosphodiesterase class II)
VSGAAEFLSALAQALARMTLYAHGHPARERAIDDAYGKLIDLAASEPQPLFTFLGDEVVFGRLPLRELKAWDWGRRLTQAGIQRLEFPQAVSREEFAEFLDEVLARLTLSAIDTTEARQLRRSSIRFGAVGVRGETEAMTAPIPTATVAYSLQEEADTLRWMHGEIQGGGLLPLAEAEAVVRSLAVAMHGDRQLVIPLLHLKEFDQYTTTHSLNVAVLTMALAETLNLAPREVRAFGIAGLVHDIGKVAIPLEVLTKPGRFTDEERALMNEHPAAGARIILAAEDDMDLPAVVAYEHHVMLNGDGYPRFRFRRDCHRASKLVHVCDVYDALRTRRPYRDAWTQERTLIYLRDRAGTEFDPEIAGAFVHMMQQWESQLTILSDEGSAVSGSAPAPAPAPTPTPTPTPSSTPPPPPPPAEPGS